MQAASPTAPSRIQSLAALWFAVSLVAFQTGIFLAQVMVAAGVLLVIVARVRGWLPAWRGSSLLGWLTAWLVWMVIAAVASPAPSDSLSFVFNKFGLPALALLAALDLARVPGATRWVMQAALIGGVFSALNGLVQYFFGVDLIYGQSIEPMPGGIVPFFLPVGLLNMALTFAGMQLLLLLFLIPWLWTQRGKTRVWGATGAAAILLSIVLAFRRGPWLGVAGAIGVFLLTRGRKVALITMAAGIVVVGVLFAVSGAFRARVLDTVNMKTSSEQDRVLMWQAAGKMGEDNLITGIGPGQWRETVPQYVDMERDWDSLAHPHSDPFWLFATGGLPAIFLAFSFGAGVLRKARVDLQPAKLVADDHPALLRAGVWLATGGLAVAGLFQCYLLDGETMIALGFLLGMAEGVQDRSTE